MLSLIISLSVALSIYFTSVASLGGWSVFWAIIAFFAVQVITALVLRKRIMAVQQAIQSTIMNGQKRLNAKMTQMQQRGATNMKVAQKVLESEQAKFINEALTLTDALEPYCKWSLMMSKQISTMRMQFHFQLKAYDKVDELLPKVLMMDPMIYAIKLAREYKKGELEAMAKTFKKGKTRFRGEKSTMVYAVYSWALVKKGQVDEAIMVLNEAVKKNSNEVLMNNLNFLKNGKVKLFSNAGLGDMWYTLYLEEMKQKPVRMKQRGGKGGRPF